MPAIKPCFLKVYMFPHKQMMKQLLLFELSCPMGFWVIFYSFPSKICASKQTKIGQTGFYLLSKFDSLTRKIFKGLSIHKLLSENSTAVFPGSGVSGAD